MRPIPPIVMMAALATPALAALALGSPSLAADPAPEQILPGMAQALLDAVAVGDKAVWQRTLAPDVLFTDENGDTLTRTQLLDGLTGLPPGVSGNIKVENTVVRVMGQVAVMGYDAMETEVYYGQTLHTHYHMIDTYRKNAGAWQLIAEATEVLPSDPVPLNPATVNITGVAGTYVLTEGKTVTVTAVDGKVMWGKTGKPAIALIPLGGDAFFQPGAPRGYKIFVRDASGKVTAIADRRDNNDVMWTKAN